MVAKTGPKDEPMATASGRSIKYELTARRPTVEKTSSTKYWRFLENVYQRVPNRFYIVLKLF